MNENRRGLKTLVSSRKQSSIPLNASSSGRRSTFSSVLETGKGRMGCRLISLGTCDIGPLLKLSDFGCDVGHSRNRLDMDSDFVWTALTNHSPQALLSFRRFYESGKAKSLALNPPSKRLSLHRLFVV